MPSHNNLRSRRNQSTFVPPQGPVPVSSLPAHHDHDTPAERSSSKSKATSTILPARPLASLPFISLLRSILLHTVSASPILLFLTTKILTANIEKLHLDNPFNPLGQLLYHTFYKHFCAGRNQSEIESVVNTLRQRGLAGVILSYAREVDVSDSTSLSAEDEHRHMQLWLEGTKRTVEYTPPGDFVAVKFSGAGLAALKLVGSNPPRKPTLELATGLEDICELAVERDVRLLIDAEHAREQEGMDEWTLDLMRKYNNRRSDGKAVVYNTYQMYLKSAPSKLAQHLSLAQSENWPLGVKLVRGAYLSSDPRELICDSQADTDKQYDDAVQMLLDSSSHGAKVNLCVATHNKESLRKAKAAAAAIKPGENRRIQEITYAQLMGMADELSFGLAQQNKNEKGKVGEETKVYKYVVWGSISECVKYLLRRAEENQSAAGRSKENVEACWEEIKFRMGLKRLRE